MLNVDVGNSLEKLHRDWKEEAPVSIMGCGKSLENLRRDKEKKRWLSKTGRGKSLENRQTTFV